MPAVWRWRWLWLIVAILAADRATKYAIERWTPQDFRRVLIPHFADLVHNQNPGIAFGMFSTAASRTLLFVLMVGSGVVVIILVWLLGSGRAGGTLSQTGIALIAGGAAGNLLDRILHGAVTDFLELHAGRFFVWPSFNLADSVIAIGAFLVAWELLYGSRQTVRSAHP